jgi:chromosome segregation ATPase
MKTADRFERYMSAVAAAVRQLADRIAPIEADMADSAASQEAMAMGMQAISEKVDKLTDMALAQADQTDRIESMFSNYLEATKEARLAAERSVLRANQLQSEVREKLKAIPGG